MKRYQYHTIFYFGLTFRNLGHVEGSQRLFAEVIGKGGKYRVVPVLEAFKIKSQIKRTALSDQQK